METLQNNWKTFWSKTGKVLNVGWKMALVIIALFFVFVMGMLVWVQWCENYGEDAHRWDTDLSENICVHDFGGTIRKNVCVYDRRSEKYVTPHLKWVAKSDTGDSLTVFCDKDDKRGFLNMNTGEIVIEGRYAHAWVFSEGLAAVVEPGGKMGFIDHTGAYVVAPELDYWVSGDYLFKHGVCCIQNREGKKGLLSIEGKWVLPQEYDYISYIQEVDMFIPTKDDREGLVKNGSFEWVYPLEYTDICWTDAPTGEGFILCKDYRSWHVAVDGTVIDDFLIDDTRELKYMVKCDSEGSDECAISDKVIAFRVYSHWGVMDKHTGLVLVPARYGNVSLASENVIKCSIDRRGDDDNVLFDLRGHKIEQYIQ